MRVHLVQVGRRAWRGPARPAAPAPAAPAEPGGAAAAAPEPPAPHPPSAAADLLEGGRQKPGSEVVVVMQRVEMTLAASGDFVVYSPTEGTMTGARPRYLFDELEFRELVGAPGPALEGCAVHCVVLATGAAAAASGAPTAQGLALDDTLCGVAGVDRPGDKPTLAPVPAGSPAPPPQPSGKPTKPGSEVVVVLQRVGVTLAASGGFVVYSPAEGVMTAVRPRYLFDELEFRERVGAPGPALEGCAVHCAVLATGAAVAANGTAMAQGLALDDTLCGVAGVDRPGDKPTLAPVPAGSPAPPPQPSGKPTKPGSEVVVVLQRVGVTLAASGGFVVYSPAEGVMMAVRPRYLFDELEFRERVGAPGPALEGCAVRCAVLATGAAAAAGGALAPQEGLALDDTLCGVAGVDRPGDKPTLALELTGSPAPPPELERLEDALPLEQHERSARLAAEALLGAATPGLAGPGGGAAAAAAERLHLGGAAALARRLSALRVRGSDDVGESLPLVVGALSFLALATCAWAGCLVQGFRAAEVEGVLPLAEGEELPHADAVRAFRQSLRGRDHDRRQQRGAACC